MIKNLLIYFDIKKKYDINKINRITDNILISNVINIFYKIYSLSNSFIYYMVLLVLAYYEKIDFVNLYIIASILGLMDNTIMFKYDKYKKIMLLNYQVNPKFIVAQYYYELIKERILSIPFIAVIVLILGLEKIYIIHFVLFIFNLKSIGIILYLVLYEKNNYIYNEDDPPPSVIYLHFIILLSLIILNKLKVTLLPIIYIVNTIGIISHIIVIKYKNYDNLVNGMNYAKEEFKTKEVIKIKYKVVKDELLSYKYLNKIFNKRHKKHYIMIIIKSILSIIVILILYKNTETTSMGIIRLVFFGNITSKIYEFYFHYSDIYFINYLDLRITYERKKIIKVINYLICTILVIMCILKKRVILIPLIYLLSSLITNIYIYINIALKPHLTSKRTLIYYLINGAISLILLYIENVKINIPILYVITVIILLISNIAINKYICKVKTS